MVCRVLLGGFGVDVCSGCNGLLMVSGEDELLLNELNELDMSTGVVLHREEEKLGMPHWQHIQDVLLLSASICFAVVEPHRILSPLDSLPADAAWIFGDTRVWVGGWVGGLCLMRSAAPIPTYLRSFPHDRCRYDCVILDRQVRRREIWVFVQCPLAQ